jgi:putative ATPase
MDLFDYKADKAKKKDAPLADRMRPETLEEFAGQTAVVGPGTPLRAMFERDEVPSMIFWGPPGVGKTTLARLIAKRTKSHFVAMSAVSSGVAELRKVVAEAQDRLKLHEERTIVFIDEIHRWNKGQQDAFLPYVEDGTVCLVGATTENPSFEINAALLSRCRVFVLEKLSDEEVTTLLRRAVKDQQRGFGSLPLKLEDGVLEYIAAVADGDARAALNALEITVKSAVGAAAAKPKGSGKANVIHLKKDEASALIRRSHLLYDKTGEEHYNIISALHKSMRGGNADAAIYWLGRMLQAGEDPLYVARRMVRFASEDIGLADSNALVMANAAFDATHKIGMPECDVILAHLAAYLALAPKSVAVYQAYGQVKREIAEAPNDPVPIHLRNAATKLMKDLDYGKDYIYTPDDPDAPQDFLPPRLKGRRFLKD